MSTVPTRPRGYPAGIAIFGSFLAMSLVLMALDIALLNRLVTRDAPVGIIVSAIGVIVLVGGLSLYNAAYVFYQARPVPLRAAHESLVWQPPPIVRAGLLTCVIGTVTSVVGLMTTDPSRLAVLLLGIILLGACLIGALSLVMRFEADHEGIRCRNPLTTVRLPWSDVESLEPRGGSVFTQRIVAVTRQGRERMLWVFDPRVPHTRDGARLGVAELEAVRRSAGA